MVVSTASPSSPRSPLRAVKTPSPPSTPTSQLRSPQSLDSTAGMLGSPTGSYGGDRSPFRSAAPELGLQGLREPLPTTAVAAAAASGSCAGAGAAVGGAGAGDGTVGSGGIYSSSSSRRAGGKGQTIITATALATGAAATTSATGDMVTASVADDVTRKNSLGSLLISSPGKDYWAGRIAAGEGSPRDSQRPHTTTGKRIKRRLGRGGGASLSPHRRGWDALSPGGRPPEKQPAGNGGSWMGKGPSLSPARVDRQGAAPRLAGSSAAWSSHAFLSPTRLPNSPLGGTAALSPSSDRVGAGGAGRFEFGAGRKPQLAAGLRSKEPLSPLGSGHALSPIGRVRRAVSASTGQDWDSGGSLNLNNRVKVTVSPMGDPSGSGFGKGGGRSVSPMQRQSNAWAPRLVSPARGHNRPLSNRVTSPSNLPRRTTEGSGRDSPERTTPQSESPERTGVGASDGVAIASSELFAEGNGTRSGNSGGNIGREAVNLVVENPDDARGGVSSPEGAEEPPSPADLPSPLQGTSFSRGRGLSPRCVTNGGRRLGRVGDGVVGKEESGAVGGGDFAASTMVAEAAGSRLSPVRGDRVSFSSAHAPPGEAGEGTKLRLGTPTGDGGASDLSLWITLRRGEEADKGAGGDYSSSPGFTCSPAPTAVGSDLEDDVVNAWVGRPSSSSKMAAAAAGGDGFSGVSALVASSKALQRGMPPPQTRSIQEVGGRGECAPVSGVTMATDEAVEETVPLLDRGQVGCMSDQFRGGGKGGANSAESWGPVAEEPGGLEGFWRALLRTFCGMFDFCHPSRTDGSDDHC
eukprot:jgi/Undpi1/1364/HiC_scaffold_11.g04756.m1